jgi:hypothetical protein
MKSQAEAQANMQRARGTAAPVWTAWLSFWVGDPLAGGSEVIGNSYARQQVVWAAPSGYQMANSNTVTFPNPTGPWGGTGVPLTHAALMDAQNGGGVRFTYLLGGTEAERIVDSGTTPPSFDPGDIVWSEV